MKDPGHCACVSARLFPLALWALELSGILFVHLCCSSLLSESQRTQKYLSVTTGLPFHHAWKVELGQELRTGRVSEDSENR